MEKRTVIVNVNDGFNGDTANLEAIEDNSGKIYFTNKRNIYYWSGQFVNRKYKKGMNYLTLPLRGYVNGLMVL